MPSSAPIARRLVLITGSTRSGTSLAAGSLHHLGLHVPLPVLRANESNPAGFFESTWPLKFHRRLMDRSHVGGVDARPEAFDLMAAAVGPEQRAELRSWLEGEFQESRQVVVKDPRAVWVTGLWQDTVEELDGRIGFLLMVRHPAEVVASRATYYAPGLEGERAWHYRVRNLCGWINNWNAGARTGTPAIASVRTRYEDLLDDWRRSRPTVPVAHSTSSWPSTVAAMRPARSMRSSTRASGATSPPGAAATCRSPWSRLPRKSGRPSTTWPRTTRRPRSRTGWMRCERPSSGRCGSQRR